MRKLFKKRISQSDNSCNKKEKLTQPGSQQISSLFRQKLFLQVERRKNMNLTLLFITQFCIQLQKNTNKRLLHHIHIYKYIVSIIYIYVNDNNIILQLTTMLNAECFKTRVTTGTGRFRLRVENCTVTMKSRADSQVRFAATENEIKILTVKSLFLNLKLVTSKMLVRLM